VRLAGTPAANYPDKLLLQLQLFEFLQNLGLDRFLCLLHLFFKALLRRFVSGLPEECSPADRTVNLAVVRREIALEVDAARAVFAALELAFQFSRVGTNNELVEIAEFPRQVIVLRAQ
jgi:hypothetical protein